MDRSQGLARDQAPGPAGMARGPRAEGAQREPAAPAAGQEAFLAIATQEASCFRRSLTCCVITGSIEG